ncbi:TPA: hypothetical protein ACGGSC_001704 [Vibrio cholerae]
MEDLISSISSIIVDYADGEFGRLDEAHVRRWIEQFDEADREIVLAETNRILKRTYITKEEFSKFISSLITSPKFSTENQADFWSNVSLCDVQLNGKSQTELVSLVREHVQNNYGFQPKVNSQSEHYIYLDDFLFSGNRLVSDLRQWIINVAPQNCHMSVVLMGWYQSGIWYVQRELPKLAEAHGKKITFKYWSIEAFRLENRLSYKDTSHVFWPEEAVMEIPEAREYIAGQKREPTFRVKNDLKNKVFSIERRTQYELAITKAGLKILGYCQSPNEVVKPLGYNRFDGFGFGSTVFSFRNCPNNNPLAFWWGDPNYPSTHPFGKWYPLLQRKTYG